MDYRIVSTKPEHSSAKGYTAPVFDSLPVATDLYELSHAALLRLSERLRRYHHQRPKVLMVRVSLAGVPQGGISETEHINRWMYLLQRRVNVELGSPPLNKKECKLTAFSKYEELEDVGACYRVAVLFDLKAFDDDDMEGLSERIRYWMGESWSQVVKQWISMIHNYVAFSDVDNFIILDENTLEGHANKQIAFYYLSQLTERQYTGTLSQYSTFQHHRTRINQSPTRQYATPFL
ncbi:hypothetical protein P7F88_05200 [Vibrio hannami]|uniref:hypothetical protein n=1 Tax=Vibrio hannami TaxID=2717094 RepID=UPI00240F2076|nr:hypothetical protein [Vibrio hannami]MDG3085529.1 hypothetical protein [Vibrio hannami]